MRRPSVGFLVALMTLAAVTSTAQAQQRRAQSSRVSVGRSPTIGPHAGYNFDADEFLFGAQASFPVMPQLDIYPSFDFYTVSGGTLWALNIDARGRPLGREFRYWYAGAGMNIIHASASAGGFSFSATDEHLNLLAGFEWPGQTVQPYAEGRITFGGGSSFQVVGGVSFRLGH